MQWVDFFSSKLKATSRLFLFFFFYCIVRGHICICFCSGSNVLSAPTAGMAAWQWPVQIKSVLLADPSVRRSGTNNYGTTIKASAFLYKPVNKWHKMWRSVICASVPEGCWGFKDPSGFSFLVIMSRDQEFGYDQISCNQDYFPICARNMQYVSASHWSCSYGHQPILLI